MRQSKYKAWGNFFLDLVQAEGNAPNSDVDDRQGLISFGFRADAIGCGVDENCKVRAAFGLVLSY